MHVYICTLSQHYDRNLVYLKYCTSHYLLYHLISGKLPVPAGFQKTKSDLSLITHAGIAAGMGRALSCVCLSVCWSISPSVCLFVCTLTGKRLELSTPNLVHVYSVACSACIDPDRARSVIFDLVSVSHDFERVINVSCKESTVSPVRG